MSILKKLFGIGPKTDFAELVAQGAQIIDVRTKQEYASGHIKGSKNIPLQALSHNLKKVDPKKPVITCCASGMRSATAKSMLKSSGYSEVYNGGGWMSLNTKI